MFMDAEFVVDLQRLRQLAFATRQRYVRLAGLLLRTHGGRRRRRARCSRRAPTACLDFVPDDLVSYLYRRY